VASATAKVKELAKALGSLAVEAAVDSARKQKAESGRQ
jgi:hypothetical protein